jgi:hypothetical protein
MTPIILAILDKPFAPQAFAPYIEHTLPIFLENFGQFYLMNSNTFSLPQLRTYFYAGAKLIIPSHYDVHEKANLHYMALELLTPYINTWTISELKELCSSIIPFFHLPLI